jgi:hypothetical protein
MTLSTDFPTKSAFQAASGGGCDAFVAKLNPGGSSLVYATYLGGSRLDEGQAPRAAAFVRISLPSLPVMTILIARLAKQSGGASSDQSVLLFASEATTER